MEPIQIPNKRIVFEFSGGFKDGCTLDSRSDDPNEVQAALGQYLMSHGGKIGTRFRTVSETGLQEMMENKVVETPEGPQLSWIPAYDMNHVYQLDDREETDELVTLRYKFMGLANPDGSMEF